MHQTNSSALRSAFSLGRTMLKRLSLALVLAVGLSPAYAVGTIPGFSLSQQFDTTGVPLGGGLLYLIQAGTTSTPQNCYQDTGLSIPYPNPVVLDAYGRVPQLFCADGQIKVRLTDKNGVQKFVQDNLLIVGASAGGGGGGTVDPTTILTTGDFKMQYGTGPISGFVRCNGRTIGSATSGASERANADTQSLFQYFWGVDANLAVSGGRGASAAADWAANKTLTLPDCRGRSLAGLDDMGNSAAGRLTSVGFGAASVTTLGSGGGADNFALTLNHVPAGITTSVTATGNASNFQVDGSATNFQYLSLVAGGNGFGTGSEAVRNGTQASAAVSVTGSGTSNNTGSSAPGGFKNAPTVGPRILTTIYIKL